MGRKTSSENNTNYSFVGFAALGIGIIIAGIASFGFISEKAGQISAKTVTKDTLSDNTCIVERTEASYDEEKGIVVHYKMNTEAFNIQCYTELMADLNEQMSIPGLNNLYPHSARISWNEAPYAFNMTDEEFVATEENVPTLLTAIE